MSRKTKEIDIATNCNNKIDHKSITIKDFQKYYGNKDFKELPME